MDKLDRCLPILQQQADRLAQLIEDILDISRLNLRENKGKFAAVQLNDVAIEVVTAHIPRIEAAGLELGLYGHPKFAAGVGRSQSVSPGDRQSTGQCAYLFTNGCDQGKNGRFPR
ncbi:MAG: hypothetical protein M5U34_04270 [Chloroflexi bacterium]|nr:hypothetical protein [Chloroflexota bacterium]